MEYRNRHAPRTVSGVEARRGRRFVLGMVNTAFHAGFEKARLLSDTAVARRCVINAGLYVQDITTFMSIDPSIHPLIHPSRSIHRSIHSSQGNKRKARVTAALC